MPHHRLLRGLLALPLILAGLMVAIVPLIGAPSAHAQDLGPTPTATPRADERPDRCEPNPDQRRACKLELDTVSGPFTFVPENDQDFYSLLLPAEADGMETTITVRGTAGLDLVTTLRRADQPAPLATISSPDSSTTLAADLTGWVVLRVENRAPGLASGQSYRVEVRRTLPPTPATPLPGGPEGLTRDPLTPDALENTYSPETAAPIGVGVLYDLNFVCPVAGACTGGDHDFLRFDVKAGTRYLLATFDLAPGVDTMLDLLWWSPEQGWTVLASNDDERPGSAFLSVLRWQAPADGYAVLRIGPRSGGLNPILGADQPLSAFRVAVALAASPLAAQIEARVAVQTNAPVAATAAPVVVTQEEAPAGNGGAPVAAPPPAPTAFPIELTAGTGEVMVTRATAAYAAPDTGSPVLGELPVDSIVVLTGKTTGIWAEVTRSQLVGAAWVDRRALSPRRSAAVPGGAPDASPAPAGTPGPSGAVPAVSGSPATRPATVIRAAPRALPEAAPPALRVTAQAALVVRAGEQGMAGMRAVLVTGFDQILSEQVTNGDGAARFLVSVPANTALSVVVPALGLRVPVNAEAPTITITLPEVRL